MDSGFILTAFPSGSFNNLKVNAPDSGNALAGVPSTQISSGRFVKAAYYSNGCPEVISEAIKASFKVQ
jgi:penicillin V acylase-like amidase (Ntn superfamily)